MPGCQANSLVDGNKLPARPPLPLKEKTSRVLRCLVLGAWAHPTQEAEKEVPAPCKIADEQLAGPGDPDAPQSQGLPSGSSPPAMGGASKLFRSHFWADQQQPLEHHLLPHHALSRIKIPDTLQRLSDCAFLVQGLRHVILPTLVSLALRDPQPRFSDLTPHPSTGGVVAFVVDYPSVG